MTPARPHFKKKKNQHVSYIYLSTYLYVKEYIFMYGKPPAHGVWCTGTTVRGFNPNTFQDGLGIIYYCRPPGRGSWHAPSSCHLRALLSVCGRCSLGGLGCCSCRVRVCRCRGCCSSAISLSHTHTHTRLLARARAHCFVSILYFVYTIEREKPSIGGRQVEGTISKSPVSAFLE